MLTTYNIFGTFEGGVRYEDDISAEEEIQS